MFRNYLLTAWKVYTRRKLFTAPGAYASPGGDGQG